MGNIHQKITPCEWCCRKTNISDYIRKSVSLPEKYLRLVTGQEVLTQTAERVSPLSDFSEEKINEASKELILSHINSLADHQILMQVDSFYFDVSADISSAVFVTTFI